MYVEICYDMIFLPYDLCLNLPTYMCASIDPVIMPLKPGEEKGAHSEPEKDEDVGITFVAHKGSETPKARPKSGNERKPQNM